MRAYVSLRCFTISSMYIVERVKLSELPCDIPSLRHSLLLFVCLHLSSLGRDRTSTFCHRFFTDQQLKTAIESFVYFESILNLLCESDQSVLCGVVTSEASLS